jgi:hypothetical protein
MTAARVHLWALAGLSLMLPGALYLLLVREWVTAAIVAGVSVATLAGGLVALRRSDNAELGAMRAKYQQSFESGAGSLGRGSGGWNPPRRLDPTKK